jgi:predicted nuclease with TOPRIM domain
MIVFPQTYNYKLIIGSLIIALSVLGVFTFQNQNKLEEYNAYLAQEKSLIQNELSEMISRFDTLDIENEELSLQLEASKLKLEQALDSIKTLEVTANLLTHYKSKVQLLKEEKARILNLVNSLETQNKTLQTEVTQSKQQLSSIKVKANTLKETNVKLKKSNETLNKHIIKASQMQITMLDAKAVKRVSKNKVVTTDKAKRTNKLLVEFVIPKNDLITKGKKDIYIQIVNPNNNVVSNKDEAKFGKQSLIYSKKLDVNFNNKDLAVSTFIDADKNEPFKQGVYFVNVFNQDNRLASTSILLD